MLSVAILCGGKGTRAQQPINKCFVEVAGKPFILHVMEQLEFFGFTTFVLCRGEDGTLAALRNAREQLGERFLVCYGDTYLPLDYVQFIKEWDLSGKPCAMARIKGIDAGVNGFTDWVLDMLDETETSLVPLQKELRNLGLVNYFPAPEPWHEVGEPRGLEEARTWFDLQYS
jgi:NDP-sugar pyrophosphorylase family protein